MIYNDYRRDIFSLGRLNWHTHVLKKITEETVVKYELIVQNTTSYTEATLF